MKSSIRLMPPAVDTTEVHSQSEVVTPEAFQGRRERLTLTVVLAALAAAVLLLVPYLILVRRLLG